MNYEFFYQCVVIVLPLLLTILHVFITLKTKCHIDGQCKKNCKRYYNSSKSLHLMRGDKIMLTNKRSKDINPRGKLVVCAGMHRVNNILEVADQMYLECLKIKK